VNPRYRLEWVSVDKARKMIKSDPKIKAAVVESTGLPIMSDPFARVRLFEKIGEAEKFLRSRREHYTGLGWKQIDGALNRGLLIYADGSARRGIMLDRRHNRL
jgi:hypothetical protein